MHNFFNYTELILFSNFADKYLIILRINNGQNFIFIAKIISLLFFFPKR